MSNINIDVPSLNLSRPMTGVGRYISDISKIKNDNLNIIGFAPNSNIKIDHFFEKVVSSNFKTKLGKIFWVLFPLYKNDKSIIHYPQPLLSPFVFKKTHIITIHDVLFLTLKEHYSFISRISLWMLTWIAVKKADTIICVSNFTKEELIRNFNPSSKIKVVYNPISKELISNNNNIEHKYLLSVSNRTPRKNLQKTIDGFLKSKYRSNGYKLLLCGVNDGLIKLNLDESVIDMGYVEDIELEKLYKNAEGLLFFSLGEGFGYPILEAAKYKTCVFASNNTSISELFNYRSELLCSDYKTDNGICNFLDKVYSSEKIRSEIQKTLSNTLKKCSFEIFEEKMINIYKSV